MRLSINRFILMLALAGVLPRAQAFSLLGAFDTWMTPEIGYQLEAQLGGPMNLGEEYRWNMPLLTYGFDSAFLNYFGTKGVEEVEKAMAIFNAIPPASSMTPDLSEWPLDTRRFNHRATALNIYDLKTRAMAAMMEAMGAAPAELYVWTLRSRVVINNVPIYAVMRRNFDPFTWEPSSYVNGVLYTYQILLTYTTPTWEAVEFEVDPSVPSVTSVSGYDILSGGTVFAAGDVANRSPGMFYTGLTRDDIAAIRYLYRPQNYNVDLLLTNVTLAPVGSKQGTYILGPNTGGGGNPWGQPGGTNVVTTNGVPVSTALRPGVDKISFVPVSYDSLLGLWVTYTNRFEDTYITNYNSRTQQIQRFLPQPDILFSAADLGVNANGIPLFTAHSMALVNQTAVNNPNLALSGPGNIYPPYVLTFNKINQFLVNRGGGGEPDGVEVFWWGSYDGTTKEPVIYPQGTSIKAVEQLILSGNVFDPAASPWLAPPIYTPTTTDPNAGGGGGGIGGGGGAGGGGTGGGGGG